MIELLMVILLVAILGAVALPQFLDFRSEAKVAAAVQMQNSITVGLKLQLAQSRLRCNATTETYPPLDSVAANDVTAGSAPICTTTQITNVTERKIVDSAEFPVNPFNNLSTVGDCSSDTYVGWCYSQSYGLIVASQSTSPTSVPSSLTTTCSYDGGSQLTTVSGACEDSGGSISTFFAMTTCSGGTYSVSYATGPTNIYAGLNSQVFQGASNASSVCN